MRQKLTLLLLMALFAVGGVNAKTTFDLTSFSPYDSNGTWDSSSLTFTASADWCGGQIWSETDWSSYDRLVIKVTSATAPFQINLESYTSSDKSAHTTVTQNISSSNDTQTYVITLDENKARFYKFEMKLNSTLSDAGGGSSYAIVISEAYLLAEDEYDSETLWSGRQATDNWENNVELSYSNKGSLANIYINDKIRITYRNAGDNATVRVANPDGWEKYEDSSEATATTGDDQVFDYTITSAAILEKIQSNGILARGKNITITKIELLKAANRYDAVSVTIGSDGIATFSCTKHLDFSDSSITPFYASAVEEGKVTLTSTTTTWGYQGYMVKGSEGTYSIPVTDESNASYQSTNYLKGNTGSSEIKASTKSAYHYIFAKNSSSVIGFYKLTFAHTLAAKKAYLETTTDITPAAAGARGITLNFDDGTTAILPIFQDGNSSIAGSENNACYTLQGIRVQNPTKGLYIQNGKKFMVK